MLGLENRSMLSGSGVAGSVVERVQPAAGGAETRTPELGKPGKQTAFVTGLYIKYFHREPQPAELSYAVERLAHGLSHAALNRDFMDVVSKTSKNIPASTFVNARNRL